MEKKEQKEIYCPICGIYPSEGGCVNPSFCKKEIKRIQKQVEKLHEVCDNA